MSVILSVGQSCLTRYADWQVMTPTESWKSSRTTCLPASLPACLSHIPWVQKSNYKLHICAVFIIIIITPFHLSIIIVAVIVWDYRCAADIAFQPPRSFSVTVCQSAAHFNRSAQSFPMSPSLLVTFYLFFSTFKSLFLLLCLSLTFLRALSKLSFILSHLEQRSPTFSPQTGLMLDNILTEWNSNKIHWYDRHRNLYFVCNFISGVGHHNTSNGE